MFEDFTISPTKEELKRTLTHDVKCFDTMCNKFLERIKNKENNR